jgi:hypothetical protein
MTQREGVVDDARQVSGGQCNKREEGEHETSRLQMMQCNWAANDTTRGGGQRTLCKVMGWWRTQREVRVDNAGKSNKAGVDNAG